MNPYQTVSEMVGRVLSRQAKILAEASGTSFEDASAIVVATEAGAQLKELGEGEHRHERAVDWQDKLALERSQRRADELGWRRRPGNSGPSPERASAHEAGSGMTSEEALVDARVRVDERHRSADLRGREGTIRATWGAKDHAALDVLLDNGILQLFWFHELRHVGNGNGSANGNRNGNGNGSGSWQRSAGAMGHGVRRDTEFPDAVR